MSDKALITLYIKQSDKEFSIPQEQLLFDIIGTVKASQEKKKSGAKVQGDHR